MSVDDIAVIVMTVASVLGLACVYLAQALEDTRQESSSDDSDFPSLDYRAYRRM